jgi:YVTN family beta-propeller protein
VIPVAAGPHGMAATKDGRRVFVGGDASSEVDVIDTAAGRVVDRIPVGKSPHGLAMAPDGRTLLVGVYGEDRIAFVDLAGSAPTVRASVAVPKPHTIAVRPDGKVAYVASQEPGNFALVVVDLETRAVVRRLPLDKPPRDPEFAFDGHALYFTQAGIDAVQVLDPATDAIVGHIDTGASPHIAGVFRGAPAGTAVVQGPGQVLLFDAAAYTPLRTIAVGKQPHWIAPANDGGIAVVTNEGSNDVSLVDLAAGTVRTVAVGTAPRKVVVIGVAAPAPVATVSIANFAFTPGETTIAAGGSVEWVNADGAPHGVAHADGKPGRDLMLPGERTRRRYETAGVFDYTCPVHPYMMGHVRVIAAAP